MRRRPAKSISSSARRSTSAACFRKRRRAHWTYKNHGRAVHRGSHRRSLGPRGEGRSRRAEPLTPSTAEKPDVTRWAVEATTSISSGATCCEHGTRKPNRTGVDTLSTFNHNYEIAASRQGFPLLTTKEDPPARTSSSRTIWFLSGETAHPASSRSTAASSGTRGPATTGKVPSAYGNFWRHFPVHETGRLPTRREPRAAFNRSGVAWVVEEPNFATR